MQAAYFSRVKLLAIFLFSFSIQPPFGASVTVAAEALASYQRLAVMQAPLEATLADTEQSLSSLSGRGFVVAGGILLGPIKSKRRLDPTS